MAFSSPDTIDSLRSISRQINENKEHGQGDEITELRPLTFIDSKLTARYGDNWLEYEPETIILDNDLPQTELMVNKIQTLSILKGWPERFFDGLLEFIHLVTVINNEELDFEVMPSHTPLELAFALEQANELCSPEDNDLEYSYDIRKYITELLNSENFPGDIYPFSWVTFWPPKHNNSSNEIFRKKTAVQFYIAYMESLS